MRALKHLTELGVAFLVVIAVTTIAHAEVTPTAPEIDGGSLSVGLAALTAGVMILRARRRSR